MIWIIDNYIEIFGAVTGIIYVFLEIRQNRFLWPVGIVTSAVYIWVFFSGKLYADMGLQVYYLIISVLGWYWWARGSGLSAKALAKAERRAPSFAEASDGKAEGAELCNTVSPFEEPVPIYREGKGDVELRENSVYPVVKKEFDSGDSMQDTGQEGNDRLLKVTRLKFRTGIILSIAFVIIFSSIWYILDRFTDSPVPAADSFITSLSIIATWMLARKIYEHWYIWLVVNSFASLLFLSRQLYPTVILYMVYFLMSFIGLNTWRKTVNSKSG